MPEPCHLPVSQLSATSPCHGSVQAAETLLVPGTVTADTASGEVICSLLPLAAVPLAHPLLLNGSLSPAPFAASSFPAQRNCFIAAGIHMVSQIGSDWAIPGCARSFSPLPFALGEAEGKPGQQRALT